MFNKQVWRDYYELCKPRVVFLMLITVWVGMFLATTPYGTPWMLWFSGLVGIGLVACSAAVCNQVIERKVDANMSRTHIRPLPKARVSVQGACVFAFILMTSGLGLLCWKTNLLCAVLTFLSLVGYAGVYTGYLKYKTPQNIVLGGLAGAMPPLLGWVAVTGETSPLAWILVMIVFVWTPPHFWALAIHRLEDYERVGIPMLPVTHGVPFTRQAILAYTCMLSAITYLPFAIGSVGLFYVCGVSVLNGFFIFYAWCLYKKPKANTAHRTFRYSIVYLLVLFLLLMADHAGSMI